MFTDPYVKVTLWQFGEIVAQFQTAVKKNTTAPSFNETFDFQVFLVENIEALQINLAL